jgi:hypothetical protein
VQPVVFRIVEALTRKVQAGVRAQLEAVLGQGRAGDVARESFELTAVAAIDEFAWRAR